MWRIEDSHKWMMTPHTIYEIRREMRVREMRQTAIAWDRHYLNIETGKLITDKIGTLNSYSWDDITVSECQSTGIQEHNQRCRKEKLDYSPIYNFPRHVHKDDDFDDELDEKLEIEAKNKIKNMVDRNNKKLSYPKEDFVVMGNGEIRDVTHVNETYISYDNIILKKGEEIWLVYGNPILDENGEVKIFKR